MELILFFTDPFRDFISISFSTLIFVQLLNSFAETHSYNIYILSSIGLSIVIYVLSFVFFKDYFGVSQLTVKFFMKCFFISVICYVPLHLISRLSLYLYPTEESKIMKKSRINKKSKFRKFFDRYILCQKQEQLHERDLF